ncbi:MAG: ornithine carbamoyltransferase [Dehalococcoidia bacterium]|nr:ornithine carbamoyltransferase [Dehalococcoidia bacterium]
MSASIRHLLSSADFTASEIADVLQLAHRLKALRPQVLDGRELALLFEKPSLRTRMSFEVGVRQLGGTTIYMAPQEVGIGEREAIKDVARAVSRYVDIVAMRTFGQQNVQEYAAYSTIPVVNALTGDEHPCQALADLLTLQEKWGDVRGRSIAYVGDGNNVAASLVVTAASLGMDVRIASPRGYALAEGLLTEAAVRSEETGGTFSAGNDIAAAVGGAEAVYTDVWTSMGQEREAERRRIDFSRLAGQQCPPVQRRARCAGHARPPAHRGEEITDEVIESPGSIVFDQVENRTWAQAAVLVTLLGLAGNVPAAG